MQWLREHVGSALPEIAFDDFIAAMRVVTEEIVHGRPPEHYEVLSQERFRRALARVGVTGDMGTDVARRLSLQHMDYLAASTIMPAEHGHLLRALASRYRIGLVSNFDHAPTAMRLLSANAVDRLFEVSIISADFGRRKPHPSIFHAALDALGAKASDAVYVGDTLLDDVSGARAAGMDVVWINPKGAPVPADSDSPTYIVSTLSEIEALLGT
jgi:HAD superfamily hydrolase (TIGR01549 family)